MEKEVNDNLPPQHWVALDVGKDSDISSDRSSDTDSISTAPSDEVAQAAEVEWWNPELEEEGDDSEDLGELKPCELGQTLLVRRL